MNKIPCTCGHSFADHVGHDNNKVACMVRSTATTNVAGFADRCYKYMPDNLGYFKKKYEELKGLL